MRKAWSLVVIKGHSMSSVDAGSGGGEEWEAESPSEDACVAFLRVRNLAFVSTEHDM